MSLSLSLDNRKHVERRMNLRLSTVNQRLMDSWIRKSNHSSPQLRDASLEFRQQQQVADNKCDSSTQQCIEDTRTKDFIDRISEPAAQANRKDDNDSSKTSIGGDMIASFEQLQGGCLGRRRREIDNNASIISSYVNIRLQEEKGQVNNDLNNSSNEQQQQQQNFGTSSEPELNQNSFKDRRRSRIPTPEIISKRIRGASNDLVESQSDVVVCSCRDKFTNGVLETSIDPHNMIDTNSSDDNSDKSVRSLSQHEANNTNDRFRNRILVQPHKLVSLSERNGLAMCNKHMPWFGIDIGGSLVKVVFFDPKDATKEETVTLKRIRRYLKSSKAYGTTGKRDAHLEMPNCIINKRIGTLHFIRFASNQMPDFLTMAKNKRFTDTINNVCATGGGANKFEEDIKTNLGITLHKTDELDSIIHGIHYIDKYNAERECYFLKDPLDDVKCVKVPYDFSRPYPYLVVNIGSGVSILAVYSSTSYSRISGSSIGGGTFLGLCCLLTQCKTFDEAIRLANIGSSTKIDKLVKDIYGGDYPKFNLSGDTVASSFGHMNVAEKRKGVKREDLARALLEMVTINIGSISRMCAVNENIDRVVFIGNFLRVNQLSMKLLSYAVNYWSKGAIKALFLEHEGYFGAVGCFVESTNGCCHN